MRVVSTFHAPSVVLHSLRCCLTDKESEIFLVTAGPSRLEVHSITPSGLSKCCSVDVWGTIASLNAVPISEDPHSRCNILLLLGHPDPELVLLSFNETTSSLVVKHHLSLFERGHIAPEFLTTAVVHPSGQYAAVHCYNGKLRAVSFRDGEYESEVDISIGIYNILAMTFLETLSPTLAILRVDHLEKIQLSALDLNIPEIETLPSHLLAPTVVTALTPIDPNDLPQLIPIPGKPDMSSDSMQVDDQEENSESPFGGGILLTGGRTLVFYELNDAAAQERQRKKLEKQRSQRKSKNMEEVRKAIEKENERSSRKRAPTFSVQWPWSPITAWCGMDDEGQSYLLGDAYGRLALLSLKRLPTHGLVIIPLGEAASPCTLTYLVNKVFYLGSRFGNSALVEILPSPQSAEKDTLPIPPEIPGTAKPFDPTSSVGKGKAPESSADQVPLDRKIGVVLRTKGVYLRTLESFRNIGPIYDAVLADTEDSGINQIVTCSGSQNTGSLNVVRTGADFQELAFLNGMEHVFEIFPVKTSSTDSDDLLILSTSAETILLKIREGRSFERFQSASMDTSLPTLHAGNITWDTNSSPNGFFVRVTAKDVTLIEVDPLLQEYYTRATWVSPSQHGIGSEIVATALSSREVVVGLSDHRILALTISPKSTFLQSSKFLTASPPSLDSTEASAIAVSDNQKFYAVAFWQSNRLALFTTTLPTEVKQIDQFVDASATIVSLRFQGFVSEANDFLMFLFAGLSNGSLVYFQVVSDRLTEMKMLSLGNQPVSLHSCAVEGRPAVFASGSRAVIFSYHHKRIQSSPIMVKDVVTAAPLNSEFYPSSVVLATHHSICIGRVREVEKLHIRSIPLGYQNPKRLEYSPKLKLFGVICRKMEPVRVWEKPASQSSLRLFDDTTYQELAHYVIPSDEEAVSLTFFEMSDFGALICVGSYVCKEEEYDPSVGRIRLFIVTNLHSSSSAQAHLAASIDVDGCVWGLKAVSGHLVATIAGAVVSFVIEQTADGIITIQKSQVWNHNNMLRHLATLNDTVVVGDVISSVSMLQVEGSELKTIARAYAPLWPIAVGIVDEQNIIACNDGWNLVAFRLNSRGGGQGQLEYRGSFYLGDCVTGFVRGSISVGEGPSPGSGMKPSQVFVAASGQIGLIIDCDPTQYDLLYMIERNLSAIVKGVGGTNHTRYRSPSEKKGKTDAEAAAAGFVDGDFIEQGLEQALKSPEDIQALLDGQNAAERIDVNVSTLRGVYDMLQRIH